MKTLRPYQQEVLDKLRVRLKETDYPLLVNASVGAGKSLIIAELLRLIEQAGWRALCLTMNSTLIRQNAETYIAQGGHAGVYCAALNRRDTSEPIIFASPMSVFGSIRVNMKLSRIPFNLIIVDECHNINFNDKSTMYMRIFNHYTNLAVKLKHKLRFVGLTGTPYRGKGHTIVGEDLFFKEEVCAVTAEWLISESYLTPPIWGYHDKSLQYDFNQIKLNAMGKFNTSELDEAIHKTPRLTGKIMTEIVEIVKQRKGAFIFASSIKHCYECAEWLPPDETAIIIGDTPDKLREEYIEKAKAGILKYLVNVNVLCTGVDVPSFDTVVFVRPTESLVLYMQCLGRGLRLADGKTDCLILDYAGNLERHGDIDNPIINKAIQPKTNDPDYCIECFDCNTLNTLDARRCIGISNDKRCDHWFEWKDCHGCSAKNDIVARYCRECKIELLDPNRHLKESASNRDNVFFNVKGTSYSLSVMNGFPRFEIIYEIDNPALDVKESFLLSTEKSVRFFYHTIAKLHFMHPHEAPNNLQNIRFLKNVIESEQLYSPRKIECIETKNGQLKIVKKYFDHIKGEKLRELDVIYPFHEMCNIRNKITFEYLVQENDSFQLIKDEYRLGTAAQYRRYVKNYGTNKDIYVLETPTKILVDDNNKMKSFVNDAPRLTQDQRRYLFLDRSNFNYINDKWGEIIKFQVFNNEVIQNKFGRRFKNFRVELYAYYEYLNHSKIEMKKIYQLRCSLSENDLERIQKKEYRYVKLIPNGRWQIEIEKFKNSEGKEFYKVDCDDKV